MTTILERPVGESQRVRVERRREGGACVLTIAGEVDATTAAIVADGLARSLDSGAARVYVSLEAVTFCDAAGLATLTDARREARQRDLRLVLVDPSPPVRRLLRLTDLDTAFLVSDTR
jgi:anti-sigma B factor antagonist